MSSLPEAAQSPLGLCAHAVEVLAERPSLTGLGELASGIAARIDSSAPARWPGDDDWIRVDEELRARLAAAFAQVESTRPALLHGARFRGVELRGMDGARALRISFEGLEGAPYHVWVQDVAHCPKAYRAAPPVAVWIDKDTPLTSPWMEALTELVLRVAGKVSDQRRRALRA